MNSKILVNKYYEMCKIRNNCLESKQLNKILQRTKTGKHESDKIHCKKCLSKITGESSLQKCKIIPITFL